MNNIRIAVLAGFLLVILFPSSYAQAQYLDDPFTVTLSNSRILTGIPAIGKTGAMGHLEFAVNDSLRDAYINPAKNYLTRSTFFVAPYYRILRETETFEQSQNGQVYSLQNRSFKNRGLFFPGGGAYRNNDIYLGGFIGYTSVYERTRSRFVSAFNSFDSETEIRSGGYPMMIYGGLNITPETTIGVSYSRVTIDYDEYGNLLSGSNNAKLSFRDEYLKLGLDLNSFRNRFVILGSVHRHHFDLERDTGFEIMDREKGLLLQAEYHRAIANGLKLAARATMDTKRFESFDTSDPNAFDYEGVGVSTAWQFGLGTSKQFDQVLVGFELEYETADFNSAPDGTVNNRIANRRRWNMRLGAQVPILQKLSGQLGFAQTIYERESQQTVLSFGSVISSTDEPVVESNLTRVTGGLNYRLNHRVEISYVLNFNSYPVNIFYSTNTQQKIYTPIVNQLTITYTI